MNIENTLFELSEAAGIGNITEAADKVFKILSKYTDCKQDGLTVTGRLNGESDYTLMLDAHIDEVGFVVTDVDKNGFLTVKNCGGIDLCSLPARQVVIHAKQQKIFGVFCSTPPHLGTTSEYENIADIKIDSLLGEDANRIISAGDFVTYRQKPSHLCGSRVTGKSLDNRAGAVCLLELAERLSGKKLPCNVVFAFTDMEELGTRGAKTAAFEISPDESVVIDVSFAAGPSVTKDCGKMGDGAMIGISPILDKNASKTLIGLANENKIPYQLEVMNGRTGTNGDVISVSKSGVKTSLVSIPLSNMHTDVETVDINDIKSVCDLIEQYILKGVGV